MKQFTFTSQLAPIIWKYLESRQNEGYTSVHCGYYMQELDCLSKELSDAPVVTKELIDAWDLLKPYLSNRSKIVRHTENDLFSSGFVLPEHRGGDGWTILHGDALDIIPHFQPGAFDAVITDPPYAGGGAKPSEKTRTTNQKYSSMSADKALPDFDGDQKDQLSWMLWTAVWMSKVRAACKPGAPICVFIDWRQLPALACAMQWAGWIWRGVAVWDKMTSRPQKGRYRQQAEFMVWGSNGPMPLQRKVGCLPGVFRHANPANRIHVTEKPLPLMREVVQICEQGGRILDPFAGAGTTVLAAVQEGCEAVGIEVTNAYYELGTERLKNALQPTETAE